MSRVVVLRTDSSSSITEIRFLVTMNSSLNSTYSPMEKESIGHWQIQVMLSFTRTGGGAQNSRESISDCERQNTSINRPSLGRTAGKRQGAHVPGVERTMWWVNQ